MKFALSGVSGLAFAASMAGFSPAFGQEVINTIVTSGPQEATSDQAAPAEQIAPAAAAPATTDRVVVTGQLIAGASEDAPSPVEVFTLDDMLEQGAPTAAEFLRSLTISSEAQGEADSQIAGAAAGFANVNLRGLGASRTLVLLNGRRFASSDGGAGADINTLPMMAVGRIDVLKDGASVTYGAGAVGGVINYVTRKNFDGFEISAEKKMFDGSTGEENIEALWGVVGESSNMMLAASWGHRGELGMSKRSFSTLPYDQQPAGWTVFNSNPSNYYTLTGATVANHRDYTQADCRAIGGEISNVLNPYFNVSGTGGAAASNALDCAVPLSQYFNLVDEEEYLRGYFEYNSDLSDTTEFHFEASYAKTDNPNIKTGASIPSGGNRATDTLRTSLIGLYQIPYAQPVYTAAGVVNGSVVNPFAQEFFDRVAPSATPGTLYTSNQWRPVMFGGNPLYPDNHRQEKQQRERWGGSMSLKGDFVEDGVFGRFLPEGTTFEYAATYSKYINESSRPDWIVSRLQNALRGYGGPDCAAIDRVATVYTSASAYDASVGIQSDTAPGTAGCEWFNPFASSFETSFVNGAPNPMYGGAAFENSFALLDWMTHDRGFELTNEALTIDAIYTGYIPGFELPGGEIGWAIGSQWRQVESRGMPIGSEDDIQIAGLDCPWGDQGLAPTLPGQGACAAQSGPYFGSGLGRQFPYFSDRQTISYFGELQLPILDNLNVQVAARREEFGPISGEIWKVAGKYDVLPELSFRASYSTNFQAPPEDIGVLGTQNGSVYVSSLFRAVPTRVTTLPGITPEDDTAMNLGVIYAPEVGGGQLRASLDFFEITIDGEVGNTSLSQILSNVFGTASPGATTAANCSAAFVPLVDFVEGSCVQGTSNAGSIVSMDQYTLNTGGFITNGLDYNVDYTRDVGPGTLRAAISATQNLVYKVKGYSIPGIGIGGAPLQYAGSFDGLGYANLSRNGTIMPKWRGNATLGYAVDDHRITLRANYISGVQDEVLPTAIDYEVQVIGGVPTNVPIRTTYGMTPEDYLDFDLVYIYDAPWSNDLQFRASVLNLTDEDPMAAQHTNAGGLASASRTGYYPGYGNPRGRQFELGVTKKF